MVTAMASNVPSRLVGELTFQEIPKRLGAASILCLPIGSIEQHGPHLPLNTDAVLAEEFTRRIIARWVETYDLWQLPTLTVSLAREHEWAPGTLSLSIQGMTALVRDLGREIARGLPTRNLAIINGHGGNRGILEALAQDLRADFASQCLHPSPRDLGGRGQRRRDTGNPWRKKRDVHDARNCAPPGPARSDPAKNQSGELTRCARSSSTRR